MTLPVNLPLDGVRVLDLTQVMFGPAATQVLADHGADVVKVERPGVGDLSRTIDQLARMDGGESASFLSLNRNKRSCAIDLGREEGRQVLRALVGQVDVIVHNFRPGVAERLGVDFATLHPELPALIVAAGSGFGPAGPLAVKGGQDMLAQSLSGAALHARDTEGRPVLHPITFGDFSSGMILAQGILLALLHRQRTGLGQLVEVNLLDTMLAAQMQEITQWSLRGFETNFVSQYLVGVFATADGWVTLVGVFRDNPLRAVSEALNLDDLSQRPEYATVELEIRNRARLFAELDAGFAALSTEECLARLDAHDILCAPVLDYAQVLNHPQVLSNNVLIDLPSRRGPVRTVGSPLHLSGISRADARQPPELGQHSRDVLLELGIDAVEIDRLVKARVVHDGSYESPT